jgi:hypothetical protein
MNTFSKVCNRLHSAVYFPKIILSGGKLAFEVTESGLILSEFRRMETSTASEEVREVFGRRRSTGVP